jgi:hypothetical protein
MESTWNPHGIHMESTWNGPYGIHMEFISFHIKIHYFIIVYGIHSQNPHFSIFYTLFHMEDTRDCKVL